MRLVTALKTLDTQASDSPQTGNFTELAVFRYLLTHTWWTSDDRYAWVDNAWTSQSKLAIHMGCTTKTVAKALASLEAAGLITRHRRSAGRGMGRLPDSIYIDWVVFMEPTE